MKDLSKYSGIGEASATMVLAALSLNPSLAFLTTSFTGKIIFFALKVFFTALAGLGLIVLNVGTAKIETIIDAGGFDKSFDNADKMIEAIRSTGRELTPEEIEAIDGPVKEAFRKFGSFGRKK